MKFSLLILIMFSIKSCTGTKTTIHNTDMTDEISGTFKVIILVENNSLTINPEINFDTSTNHVSGFSGCNRYSGSYTIDGNKISFGPLASTKMMCREEANTVEQQMFETLSQVNSYLLINNELTLLKDKTVLITAKQDNLYIIDYTAQSRGLFQQIIISDQIVSIQKDRNSKPISHPYSNSDWAKLITLLDNVNIESISKLEPPSKAHQYDGAAIATLKITYKGKTYKTQSFDHGNPPKKIEALVNEILSISQKIE